MKIGVVGPGSSIDIVLREIDQKALFIELIPIPCATDEVRSVVDQWQDQLSGIMFTGYLPFIHACQGTAPKIPWEYMSRTVGSLLSALLSASYVYGCDVSRITYDLQEDSNAHLLNSLTTEAGIPKEKLVIYHFESKKYAQCSSEEYVKKVEDFHLNNLVTGKANICLTGLNSVRTYLESKDHRAFWLKPTADNIRQQMNKLVLRCRMEEVMRINTMYNPVVLAIDTELKLSNKGLESSEFARHRCASNVADVIYTFAQRTGSAVEYHEGRPSFLYTTNGELGTDESNPAISILSRNIQRVNGISTISIGMGIGPSHGLAKASAEKAMRLARLRKGVCYYIISQDGNAERIVGPLATKKDERKELEPSKNGFLEEVSRNTGLGMLTLQRISDAMEQYGLDVTNAQELAQKCEMTNSNINRILGKLEATGYLEIVGRQPLAKAGRPRKLIRLKLEQP